MLSNIKKFAETSETLKEARTNVKEMSLAKEIPVFIVLYVILLFSPILMSIVTSYLSINVFNENQTIKQLLNLFGIIIIPIMVYIIVTKGEKHSWRSVGVSKGDILSSCLKGLFIGFIMFFIVVIIGFALGQYEYHGFDLSSIILLIPFFFGFLVQSFGEEFHERGWALTFISKRHSVILAIIISSIAFSITHIFNSGIDILSIINIALVGLLFAVLFLKYDNIWICGCSHAAWNFSQGMIFGFNVSGKTTPSLLKFSQVSQNIIGGGKFGPESSLITTFVIIITLFIILYIKQK